MMHEIKRTKLHKPWVINRAIILSILVSHLLPNDAWKMKMPYTSFPLANFSYARPSISDNKIVKFSLSSSKVNNVRYQSGFAKPTISSSAITFTSPANGDDLPFPASAKDIVNFHSQDCVDFFSSVSPKTLNDYDLKKFNISDDCPVFDGLFNFSKASAGGSIDVTIKLNRQDADIAINWAGGLHHAKKSEASGFCYFNDIILGILELLKMYPYFICPNFLGMVNFLYVLGISFGYH
ncbi:uncharacterized protein LOC132637048 [Lycium barbarum]|uniref:uncharacterized protein LOC132637048 n=1 Tax=Lycium barbarum TaxID=112863 RepID=UPI00293E6FC7|nr:uncharacterized protein LOC132637048 [Lycium barbarum]